MMKCPARFLIVVAGLATNYSVGTAAKALAEEKPPQVRITIIESRLYPQVLDRKAGREMAELREKQVLRGAKARTLLAAVHAAAEAGNPVVRGNLTVTTPSGVPAQVRVGKKTQPNLHTVYTPRVLAGKIELSFRFTAVNPGEEPTGDQSVERTVILTGDEQIAVRLPDSDPATGEHLYWLSAGLLEP